MRLSLLEVKSVFNDLISSRITREEAEKWAELRMQALDIDDLIFDPSSDENLLWDAVIYLSGVGLQIGPDEYFEDMDVVEKKFNLRWNR